MKIFKKDGRRQQSRLEKRISNSGTSDLVIWVEVLLPEIGRAAVHHGRDGIESLIDAEANAEAVLEIIKELKRRHQDG